MWQKESASRGRLTRWASCQPEIFMEKGKKTTGQGTPITVQAAMATNTCPDLFRLQLLTASKWQDLWPTNRHGCQPINLAKGSNVKGHVARQCPEQLPFLSLSITLTPTLSLSLSRVFPLWELNRKQKSPKAEAKCKLKRYTRRMLNGRLRQQNK